MSNTTGWGISSTTVSVPFHSYTKSPDVKHARMAPRDADRPLPAIPEDLVAAPPRHQADGRAPTVTAVQWKLSNELKASSVAKRIAAEHVDDPAKNYLSLLDDRRYFKFASARAGQAGSTQRKDAAQAGPMNEAAVARQALAAQLDAVRAQLDANLPLPPEVRGAPMDVLTKAVSLACKRHDPAIAARALACLRQVDLPGSIADPAASRPAGFDRDETAVAWRIAIELEKNPLGFACLKKISRPPHAGQAVPPAVASHDDRMLHAFLAASGEKTRLERLLPPDPQGVLEHMPERPRDLLDKCLVTARAHLRQSQEHLRTRPDAPFVPLAQKHEWAVGAVNNGFLSDQRKDDKGRTTPFHKADQRLRKMSKWVSLANGTNDADRDGAKAQAKGKQASAASKTARFLRNTLLPEMKKSPLNAINRLIDGRHTNLIAETLNASATQAGWPASVPDPAVHPGWNKFKLANKRATQEVQPAGAPTLRNVSKAEMAQTIENHTRNHELGSRVTFYSGGVAGFGLKQVSGVVSRLISKNILRVNADLKGERARCATVEIGTGAPGSELFLGTQRMLTGQAGAEGTDKKGVMIRFERISGGVAGDQANNARLARLAAKLMAPGAHPEGDSYINAADEDADSPLKNLFQEWPQVSIGLVESKDKAGHASGSASAALAARFGNFQLGLRGLGASLAGRFRGRVHSAETGGTLNVEKKSRFWNVKASASASAGALGALAGIADSDIELGLTGSDGVGVTAGVWKNGFSQTDTLIEHHGELKKNSVRIKTHQTARSFVDSVAPHLEEWAEAYTRRFNRQAYGATAPPDETPAQEQERIRTRNAAIEAEHKLLRQHLQRSLEKAEPTQNFWEFKEVKADAVAVANALQSVAAMSDACGDKRAAKDCTKARDALLDSEAAWEPAFLIDDDSTTASRTMTPVSFLFKSRQIDGINVSNMRTLA